MFTPAFPALGSAFATPHAALDEIVDRLLDIVARLMGTRLTVVSRIESTTATAMAVIDQHHTLQPGHMFALSDTFCMHMLSTGEPLVIPDTTQASTPLRCLPAALELDVRSYLGVPLFLPDGRVFGSLWVADSAARTFSDSDIALLQVLARLLMHELDRDAQTRHHERIEQIMAMHSSIDRLTGLLARDSFEAALNREVARRARYSSVYTIAVLHLVPGHARDDRHGARRGDTLRQGLADILMRASRIVDCCARIDTDTFAILFAETTPHGVKAWRGRIEAAIDAWNRMHTLHGLTLDIGIGVADCTDLPDAVPHTRLLLDLAERRAREARAHNRAGLD
jgi:diguanylate cyclase (GGDEF)-like protein